MSNHWDEPEVCRGCEREPRTTDPLQCLNELLDKAADDAYDRMRDERDERTAESSRSCP